MEQCMVLNDSTSIKIPIKDKPHNQFPFPAIRSNLCTLTIFKYIEKREAFHILRWLSHSSRAYCFQKQKYLRDCLVYDPCFGIIKSKSAVLLVLQFYGRPNVVAMMMQQLSFTSREYFKRENGFRGFLKTPQHFSHLSKHAIEFEDYLAQARLKGWLKLGK